MRHSLFPADAQFFKANLHAHTILSDGRLTPAALRDAYLAHGYAAVAFTDHELLLRHDDLACAGFVPLHGYETAVKTRPAEHTGAYQQVYHLNLIAPTPDAAQPFLNPRNSLPGNGRAHRGEAVIRREIVYDATPEGVTALVRLAHEDGFFVSLNHPEWSMIPPQDYLRVQGLDALEVYNTRGRFDLDTTGIPYGYFLRRGAHLGPVAGDDNHNDAGFADSFGGFTMIAAKALSYADLFCALRQGQYYASNGPLFSGVFFDGEAVEVTCSPVQHILLRGEGRVIRHADGDGITHAVFPLGDGFRRFFRVELWDGEGRAFTRGVFAAEWESEGTH